ncbi:MAG: hypothetical protein OER92_07185 [Alphaproteobacteria bacterium]|nr:hypothetical protein [Alphaproteobacteria bacterium]
MPDKPRKRRVQRRVERLKNVRLQQVTARKRAAAAALAVGFAVITLYLLFFSVSGEVGLHWSLALVAAASGGVVAWQFGVRSGPSGILSGILAGIWIFLEIVFAVVGVAAACLAALLSPFG